MNYDAVYEVNKPVKQMKHDETKKHQENQEHMQLSWRKPAAAYMDFWALKTRPTGNGNMKRVLPMADYSAFECI